VTSRAYDYQQIRAALFLHLARRTRRDIQNSQKEEERQEREKKEDVERHLFSHLLTKKKDS
jgi:hypothetical protein